MYKLMHNHVTCELSSMPSVFTNGVEAMWRNGVAREV